MNSLDILFMTKVIPDYLHDALYYGLRMLGHNVVDYPVKPSLHGTPHPSEFHSQQLLFHFQHTKLRKPNPDLLIVTALGFDYNPVGSQNWSRHVLETIDRFKPSKTVMVDAQDTTRVAYPPVKKDFDVIFKREMKELPNSTWDYINFAATPEPFLFRFYSARRYDFSFISSISNDFRVKTAEFLRDMTKKHGFKSYIHCEKYHVPRPEYLEVLSQSKMAVSVRGMGYHCYRYFEIPAKGTIMVTEDLGHPIRDDYKDGVHCFKFKDFEDLERILLKSRTMSDHEMQTMACSALNHTLEHHTPEALAGYFLDRIYKPR